MITKMIDEERCLMCKTFIGKGNELAICYDPLCLESFEYEQAFNKFGREEADKVNAQKQIHLAERRDYCLLEPDDEPMDKEDVRKIAESIGKNVKEKHEQES